MDDSPLSSTMILSGLLPNSWSYMSSALSTSDVEGSSSSALFSAAACRVIDLPPMNTSELPWTLNTIVKT